MSVEEIKETRQYLTFKLDEEVFAIDVAKVREVLDLTTITKIPRTPDFMSGVINLQSHSEQAGRTGQQADRTGQQADRTGQQVGRIVLVLDPAELLTRAERGLLDTFQAEALAAQERTAQRPLAQSMPIIRSGNEDSDEWKLARLSPYSNLFRYYATLPGH